MPFDDHYMDELLEEAAAPKPVPAANAAVKKKTMAAKPAGVAAADRKRCALGLLYQTTSKGRAYIQAKISDGGHCRLVHLVTVNADYSHNLIDKLAETIAHYDIGHGDLAEAREMLGDLKQHALESWP